MFQRVPLPCWEKDYDWRVLSVTQPQASCIRSQLLRLINVSDEATREFQFSSSSSSLSSCSPSPSSLRGKWLILRATNVWDKSMEGKCRALWPAMPASDRLPLNHILALVHVADILPANDARLAKDPFVLQDHWVWILDRIVPLKRIPHDLTCDPLIPASRWLVTKIRRQIQLTRLTELEMQHLAHVLLLHLLPEAAKTQTDAPAKTPVAKICRTQALTQEERRDLRHLTQNTPPWYEARKLSWGSSDLGDICCVTQYRHNVHIWQRDTGQIAEDERFKEEFFCFDHGHLFQDTVFMDTDTYGGETREETSEKGDGTSTRKATNAKETKDANGLQHNEHTIYCLVMRCKGRNVGIIVHPKYPYNHTSLDGMVHHSQHFRVNLYTLEDWRQGIVEIKMKIYVLPVLGDKEQKKMGGILHKVEAAHAVQMMNQMDCAPRPCESIPPPPSLVCPFLARWIPPRYDDYVSTWRMNERKPPIEYKSSHHKILWMVMAEFISRVYFHIEFADIIQRYLTRHMEAVRDRVSPKRYDPAPLPPFAFLPLKHMYWFLHFESELDSTHNKPLEFTANDQKYSTIVQTHTCRLSSKQVQDAENNVYLKSFGKQLNEMYVTVVLHHYWDCPVLTYSI